LYNIATALLISISLTPQFLNWLCWACHCTR